MYLSWDIGIKNLSYCILDYNEDKTISIIDWGVIDLLKYQDPSKYCNQLLKSNGTCHKKASFYKDVNYYCKTHSKNNENLKELSKKMICCQCKKIASHQDISDNSFYCKTHCDSGSNVISISQNGAKFMPLFSIGKLLYKELDSKPLFSQVSNISLENQPSAKAPKMKSIQMILYSYFVMKSHEGVLKIDNINMISAKHKLRVYKNEYGDIDSSILKLTNKYTKNKKLAVFCTHKYLENEHDDKWRKFFNDHKKKDDLADAYLMGRYYISQKSK
jgi:hypothetical protein